MYSQPMTVKNLRFRLQCVKRHINDFYYLIGNKASHVDLNHYPRRQNFVFQQNTKLKTDVAESLYQVIEIRSFLIISGFQEVFLDYGSNHVHRVLAD